MVSLLFWMCGNTLELQKGFSKKPLQERLASEGIGYVHLKSAGNPSRNRKAGLPSDQVIARYREHLDADSSCLEEVLLEVRRYAAEGGVCLLCYEPLWRIPKAYVPRLQRSRS